MLALDLLIQKIKHVTVQSTQLKKDIMFMIAELLTTVTCITIGAMVTLLLIWSDRREESQSRGDGTSLIINHDTLERNEPMTHGSFPQHHADQLDDQGRGLLIWATAFKKYYPPLSPITRNPKLSHT